MNTQIGSTIIDRKRGSNALRETEINKATETIKPSKGSFSRRSFLGKSLAAGAVTMGAGLLANTLLAKEGNEKG
ncbi:MAG TPA: twin-arginine translocation signal domain-containing protein, partial [Candidatus Binatia bacterium]